MHSRLKYQGILLLVENIFKGMYIPFDFNRIP